MEAEALDCCSYAEEHNGVSAMLLVPVFLSLTFGFINIL